MQENDPPYLTVGTEVSAKYKGAFCEAKIRKVVRVVKCKVTFKSGLGSVLLSDDQIKGSLRIGANVEARHPDKNAYIEAVINKIQDCSQYTVVFDDGDITTLRRSALCLKSGRHFNESDTLDHLPLTHPEHFSNPVVGGRRNVRRRRDALSDGEGDDSDDDSLSSSTKGTSQFNPDDGDVDIGKVVCVEITDKKKGKDSWFPAVIVSPSAQETVKIRTKDEYLVRSFRDGRYYTVPKKEITSFSKDSHGLKNDANSNVLKTAIEKAIQFIDKNELPAHWDKDVLFSAVDDPLEETTESPPGDANGSESEDSEDETQAEEKDLFVAKLYKYMEERGTPINKVPIVCNRDLDLHKLYKVVVARGGYNKVTNSSQWKTVTVKMGFGSMPSTSTINLVKQGYKKFIHNFEEFTRKLGCNFPIGSSSSSARSNRIMFRDRHTSSSSRDSKKAEEAKVAAQKETPKESTPPPPKEIVETVERVPTPVIPPSPSPPTPQSTVSEDTDVKKTDEIEEVPRRARSRQENRQKIKDEGVEEKEKEKEEEFPTPVKKRRRRLTKSKDEKTKPMATVVPVPAEVAPPESPVPSVSVATPVVTPVPTSPVKRVTGRGKYKRKDEKKEMVDPVLPPEEYPSGREFVGKDIQIQIGDKLSVYYGKESEGKKYEAKVVDRNDNQELFFVHYAGWNTRYDEWIPRYRIAENLSLRTDQVTSVPQGRGPSQSSTSDGTVSDSGTAGSFKGPTAGIKAVRKKLKPTLSTPVSAIKAKANITPRKRLSSEGDAKSAKRPSRKRVLSGGEPVGDSSESEGKVKTPKRIRKPKKIYDPGEGDWKKSVPSPDILDFSNEERRKETSQPNQVIDLNKLRSEMKGIDKMVKVTSVIAIPEIEPESVPEQPKIEPKTDTEIKTEVKTVSSGESEGIIEIKEEKPNTEKEHVPTEVPALATDNTETEKSQEMDVEKEEPKECPTDVSVPLKKEIGDSDKETLTKQISEDVKPLVKENTETDVVEIKSEEGLKIMEIDDIKEEIKPEISESEPVAEPKPLPIEEPKQEPAEVEIMEPIPVPTLLPRPAQVSSIEIIPAPSKGTKILAATTAPITRPPLPALLRASTPTSVLPNLIPPIRSTTPITISIPPRSQRPILIKCPTPTTSTITTVLSSNPASTSTPPPQLIIAKPLIIPKGGVAAGKPPALEEKEGGATITQQLLQMASPPVPTRISVEKVVSPTITLITTTSPVKPSPILPVKGSATTSAIVQSNPTVYVRPKLTEGPKVTEGPKLASYPTARIRAATGALSTRPSTSKQLVPSSLTAGLGGVKRRRKIKSKQFIDSSGSSDEQEAKRQKRQVYAPKTSFKQVSLQVTQPSKTSQGNTASTQSTASMSTTVGAVVASAAASLAGPSQKKSQVSAKVTPILKVQYGSEKRSLVSGGKIVSGKYTRVEPVLKIVKKPPPTPILKPIHPTSAAQSSKSTQPPVRKVQPLATPSPPPPPVVAVPPSQDEAKSVEVHIESVGPDAEAVQLPPSPPTIQLPEPESPKEEEVFTPFKTIAPPTTAACAPISEELGAAGSGEAVVVPETAISPDEEEDSRVSAPGSEVRSLGDSSGPENIDLAKVPELHVPEEESCHSLLCEEEIPGSPTPGADSKSFLFDDTNAMEFPPHKMTLPVGRAESVLNPSVFSSPQVVLPPPEKALSAFPPPPTQLAADEVKVETATDSVPVSFPPLQTQERAFTEVSAAAALLATAMQVEVEKTKQFFSAEETQVESSPLPMSSTSSISTGSPRGGDADAEVKLSSGENKSKEPSDTDSIDCLPKCEDIVDENSSSEEDDNDIEKYSSLYEKSSGRSRSPSSSPRKRRAARRDSPDDSPPRSYRMGHRSSIKRGLDADYGRMPPPQPPVNLGKPPYSEKYNFIPVLTDSMTSDERVDLCMTSLSNLREKWKELKTELSFYDRKKKRIRKRKREQEKREKEALLKSTTITNC